VKNPTLIELFGFFPASNFTGTSVVNLETDSSRQGIELTASWSIENFDIQGSASFLDSEQDNIEEIRRPDFLASATATWSPNDALDLTVNVDHNGAQLDTDFATFQNVELGSFTLLGANGRFNVTENIALTLRGANLLDEEYQEVVGFASAGRAIFGGLELDF